MAFQTFDPSSGREYPGFILYPFFHRAGQNLIIEFVPKQDDKVQILLSGRDDVFPDYREDRFESEFERFFSIEEKVAIPETCRTLYRMTRKGASA